MGKSLSRSNINITAIERSEDKNRNDYKINISPTKVPFDVDHDLLLLLFAYIREVENIASIYIPPDITELIVMFTDIHYDRNNMNVSFHIGSQFDFCDVSFTQKTKTWLRATIIAKKENDCEMDKKYRKYIDEGYDNKNMTNFEIRDKFGILLHLDGFPEYWDDYFRWILSDKCINETDDIICNCSGECKYINSHRIAPYHTQSVGGVLNIDYPVFGTPNNENIIGLTHFNQNTSFINALIQCLFCTNYAIFSDESNPIIDSLFTLFGLMKSNQFKVVSTHRLCTIIKNKYKPSKHSNKVFLKWFLTQIWTGNNCKIWLRKKCEACDDIQYDEHIDVPLLSLSVSKLTNKQIFYLYDDRKNNHTMTKYVFDVREDLRLIDIQNVICELRDVAKDAVFKYFKYDRKHNKITKKEIKYLDSNRAINTDDINGFSINFFTKNEEREMIPHEYDLANMRYDIKLDLDKKYIVKAIKSEAEESKYEDEEVRSIYECMDDYINNVRFDYDGDIGEICTKHHKHSRILTKCVLLSLPKILFINIHLDRLQSQQIINYQILDFKRYSFSGNNGEKQYIYKLFALMCFDDRSDEYHAYILQKESNEWYRIKNTHSQIVNVQQIFREKHVCVLCYEQ